MHNIGVILSKVISNKGSFTEELILSNREKAKLRPLDTDDVSKLTLFLESLSKKTREQSSFSSYDVLMAQELCDAVGHYDKLRFVLENSKGEICGLFEFSLTIPKNNLDRFEKYGVLLGDNDCRWGITITDRYQDSGVGKLIFPFMVRVAMEFRYSRLILYGGVLADNERALHYYKKLGFMEVGKYINQDKVLTIDMILDLSNYSQVEERN